MNFPWEKPVTLEIYNKSLNESILIDFVNLKLSTKCEITKIYNDNTKIFMRKQYVNKFINNSNILLFFLVIYFLNFYLNIEKK